MPVRKRARGELTPQPSSGRRRSQRISSTGKKSNYFDNDDGDDDVVDASDTPRRGPKKAKTTGSAKAREDSEEPQYQIDDSEEDTEGADTGDEEVEEPPPRKKKGRPAKATPKTRAKAAGQKKQVKATTKKQVEVESDDGSEEDDDDPDITIIPLPKLKDTGGIEYEDEQIHPNTMEFLKELKANNKRSWLKLRDPEYRRSLKDWESFVESLTAKIIEADFTIPELPLKDVIFRIYRDIRFSKDPTPYKPHYSAAWSRTGRKGPYACYYVHCEPGSCFVGGGLWHPDKDALARLRANIDERPHRLRRVLMNPQFRSTFLPKAKDNENSVLAAFAEVNQENALKTKPQGFLPDHRDIELLKLRNYTVGRSIKDSDLTSEDAQDRVMAIIRPMVEYVTFLNRVVMPDPNIDDDSSEEEEEGEGDGPDEDDEDDEE